MADRNYLRGEEEAAPENDALGTAGDFAKGFGAAAAKVGAGLAGDARYFAEKQGRGDIAGLAQAVGDIFHAAGDTFSESINPKTQQLAAAALTSPEFLEHPALGRLAAESALPICLMHAQGTPATMQADPRYDDVLLDVYDFLEERLTAAEAMGIPRDRLIADPGIGFGKTMDHNLTLLRGLSLFHGLGVPILLGASRKRFIGTIAEEPQADRRDPGSIAVTLAGVAQGIQIHRVHDTESTRQALCLWQAVQGGVTT